MTDGAEIGSLRAARGLGGLAALIGIAPEGAGFVLGPALLGALCLALGQALPGVLLLVVAFCMGAFFRDPERFPKRSEGVFLAAADGRVTDIRSEAGPEEPHEACQTVTVFMSPLDVHVNRAPVGGEVRQVRHTRGAFRAAFRDDSSKQNERNLVVFEDAHGGRHAIVQVAGYLARRIVCRVRPGDRVVSGQRIGLIMFGSRVDHYLPAGYRVVIKKGDRVRAGETVIGELSP